jgi:hypothetical protein
MIMGALKDRAKDSSDNRPDVIVLPDIGATLYRDQEGSNRYGCEANAADSSQRVMEALKKVLEKNRIPYETENGQVPANLGSGGPSFPVQYTAVLAVEGPKNVDKLFALSAKQQAAVASKGA